MCVKTPGRIALALALLAACGTAAPGQSGPDPLAGAAGWYEIAADHHILVTRGPREGLRLLDFDRARFGALTPAGEGRFEWRPAKAAAPWAIRFVTGEAGRVTALEWREGDAPARLAPRSDAYGYGQEEVRFSSAGVELAGLLLTPRSPGPHPAAAVVHGSGPSDRDNVWAFTIADALARRGVAVLLPDKRGSGASGGDWRSADFWDLSNDALAAVRLLAARDAVDPARVGLVGLSQGGWVAPLAAARSRGVAFVVNVSGAAVTPREQIDHEMANTLRGAGFGDAEVAELLELHARMERYMRAEADWSHYEEGLERARSGAWAAIARGFPSAPDHWAFGFYRRVGDFDPVPVWRSLRIPVLVVYGAKDEADNVPVRESVARLKRAAGEGRDVTVTVYPESGHAIEDPATGWVRRDFLSALADWVRSRARTK